MATSPNSPAATAFTRFIFIVGRDDGEAFLGRLRSAGSAVARGFFNDFDADGTRDTQAREAIQFLVAEGETYPDSVMAAARHVVQITGKYRPKLEQVEVEMRRRLGDAAGIFSIEGAERPPRYTSAELHDFAYRRAAARRSGRQATQAIILPINKTADWWAKPALERHAYFYPHVDEITGCAVAGHARAAEPGVADLYRRLFHNPDGYQRPGEFDFITYFEYDEEHGETFDRIHSALQDVSQNPEWRYVREGPVWRGRRVLKW
ncbi:MAG TPA: hypothetical protein VFV95_02165 [Vicinamibacterales bacterium]|nr:hypothetical protein [Vicinamibacterales bacterium]